MMRHRRPYTASAFSLIELMIAMVFLVIAFFGYVALHSRILHSGQQLEKKEVIRAATDYYSGILVSRAIKGGSVGPDGTAFEPLEELPNAFIIDTTPTGNLTWLTENQAVPKPYHKGMDETMQLSPIIVNKPYEYDWARR